MCGISGVIGANSNAGKILLSSLRNLEYRGYDSCGIAVLEDDKIKIKKHIGTVDEVNAKERLSNMSGNIGIAHTRWATHGGVTKENAHPHPSTSTEFVVVHNGIISNYMQLREELQKSGITFVSDTDTEVISHLLEQKYRQFGEIEVAFVETLHTLEGSFALAVMSIHDRDRLYCAKQDSPLILGIGEGRNFIGSDINAFLEYTRNTIIMDDGEYAIVSQHHYEVKKQHNQHVVQKKQMIIEWDVETTRKGGFHHYMLKEIFDEPSTITQALKVPQKDIEHLASMIHDSKICYLLGVGTTNYVAMVAQYYFSHFAQVYLPTISSDEFRELAIIDAQDMVLAISQSGETYDTKKGIDLAKSQGAKTAAVVNVMGSSLSNIVDYAIMQGSGPEICVVSTKAALAQVTILLRTALTLGKQKGILQLEQFEEYQLLLEEFPQQIQSNLNEQSGFIRNLARKNSKVHDWLFLGCGVYYPIALESALKMKEVTYLHAEGMGGGFLKHGTLAMVEASLNSLFFIPPPEDKILHERTLIAVEEVKARGGAVLGLMFQHDEQAKKLVEQAILLPRVSFLVAPMLQMIMAQLLSYYCALDLGRNIDKPRNLAKSVTVA